MDVRRETVTSLLNNEQIHGLVKSTYGWTGFSKCHAVSLLDHRFFHKSRNWSAKSGSSAWFWSSRDTMLFRSEDLRVAIDDIFSPSSISLFPLNDPEWKLWGCCRERNFFLYAQASKRRKKEETFWAVSVLQLMLKPVAGRFQTVTKATETRSKEKVFFFESFTRFVC